MNKDFWDQRYAEEGYAYGTEVNEFLKSQAHLLKPGARVLAVGDGEGRNGVWLAEQGMQVVSVDYSQAGLAKAREMAAARDVPLETLCVDLFHWDWPVQAFDLIVVVFVHFPPQHRLAMHQAMYTALQPGGLIIMEAFTKDQLAYSSGGPPVAEMLYTPQMMREDFAQGEIVLLDERITSLVEGKYHSGDGAVLRLIVRKTP